MPPSPLARTGFTIESSARRPGPHAGPAGRRDVRRLPAPSWPTRPTAGTGTRSSAARTAGRASRSSSTCPTTGRATTMAGFPLCARVRRRSTPTRPTGASTPRPSPATTAARRSTSSRPAGRRRPLTGRRRRWRAAARALLADGRDRRGQGARRLPPRLRRDGRRRGRRACASARTAATSRSRSWCADLDGGPRGRRGRPTPRPPCSPTPRRPVVLLRQRRTPAAARSPPTVAPGNPRPGRDAAAYTPVHHLLFGLPGDPPGPRCW